MSSSPVDAIDNDILSRAVAAIDVRHLKPVARMLADVQLPESDLDRFDELLAKKGGDGLTDAEESELTSYLRVGSFLDMIRARAERMLSEECSE